MAGNYERTAPAEADSELLKYKRWYREDVVVANKWRKEAKEDFQFRDGHQWSREDKQVLEDQGRPVITFNRTGVLVDAVVGLETGNRRETRFIPREPGDSIANELLTSAADWFRDSCDAEDEESEAFKDTVTAGMGWTETRLDRTNNPDGEPKIERVDPFEMVWSASASKANLVDSKRLWRVRSMSIEEARKLAPDASDDDLNAAWADAEEDDEPSRSPATYDKEVDGPQGDRRKVTVVQCQYREEETYYKAVILSPPAMQPLQVFPRRVVRQVVRRRRWRCGLLLQSAIVRKVLSAGPRERIDTAKGCRRILRNRLTLIDPAACPAVVKFLCLAGGLLEQRRCPRGRLLFSGSFCALATH